MRTPISYGTPHWHLHRTGAAACRVALSISTGGHVWACLGPDLFAVKIAHSRVGSGPHLIHGSLDRFLTIVE